MKKRIALVLSAIMLISFLPSVSYAAGNTISSAADLLSFRDSVNSGNTYEGQVVTLTSQLDLSSIDWTAVGTEEHPFKGTFNGGGNTITGLNASGNDKYMGLFGYSEGDIKNLNIITSQDGIKQTYTEENLEKMRTYAGIIAAYSTGNIENCTADGYISSSNNYSFAVSGGICGRNGGTIANCENSVRVTVNCSADAAVYYADAYAGGICGINDGIITGSSSDNTDKGSSGIAATSRFASAAAGGIAGDNRGTISQGVSSGVVRATTLFGLYTFAYGYSGGICGSNTGAVNNSSSQCNVWGNQYAPEAKREDYIYIGGICGYNKNEITNCTFSGKAGGGHNGNYKMIFAVGGVCGYNYGKISYCTFAESAQIADMSVVSGDKTTWYSPDYAGGICGYNSNGAIEQCRSYGTVSLSENPHTEKTTPFYYGGIAGVNDEGYISCTASKTKVTLSGTASELFYAGGFTGKNSGNIENCSYAPTGNALAAYNCAAMTAENSGHMENCYANFRTGYANTKGIAVTNTGTLRNVYYACSSVAETIPGTKKTPVQLTKDDLYTDWPIGICWTKGSYALPSLTDNINQYAFSGGSGTEQSPYIIKTAQDLYNMRFDKSASYKIESDITYDGLWSAIGNECDPFTGTINGNYHTIAINGGLIGYGSGCVIKNLSIKADIDAVGNDMILYTGTVVEKGDGITAENCSYSGNISVSGNGIYAGGIVGYASGTLIGCRSFGTIVQSGDAERVSAGGLAGRFEGNISECDSAMNISANGASGIYSSEVGGLCGVLVGDILDSCHSGTINHSSVSPSAYTGGLAGTADGNITRSYSDTAITADENIGGISGKLYGGECSEAYFNEENPDNGTGIPTSGESFTAGGLLNSLRHDGGYIWTADKESGKPIPLHITPLRIMNNGFMKCGFESNSSSAEIYFTADGSNPIGGGTKYTEPFFCSNIDNVQYYAKDGGADTQIFNYSQAAVSKYPLCFTELPENQNGEKLTKENINSATSVKVKFVSNVAENATMYLAFYDESGALKYAKCQSTALINGENEVTFTNVNISNVAAVRIFVWNSSLIPYTEKIEF